MVAMVVAMAWLSHYGWMDGREQARTGTVEDRAHATVDAPMGNDHDDANISLTNNT